MDNPGFSDVEKTSEGSPPPSIYLTDVELRDWALFADGKYVMVNGEPAPDPAGFTPKKFPQLAAAFAALIGAFCFGSVLGYSAVSMPKLRLDPGFPHPTEDQISWMSSVITLGALTSCVPAGLSVDRFGRRKTLLLLTLPFVGGWFLIYFAHTVTMLMIGRFITGLCGGFINLAAPIYIAETCQPKIRGMLINGFDLMACFGFIFINLIGKFLEWRTQALICAFIPLLSHAILFFVPESPRYLLSKGDEEGALTSLCWFRGAPIINLQYVKPEFYCLIENIEQSRREDSTGWRRKLEEFKRVPVLKALLVIFLLFFFREFSGILPIDFYTVDIFHSAGSSLDAYTSSIIVYSVSAGFSMAAALLVDRVGRKVLLVLSQGVMTVSLTGLGVFFYFKHQDAEWALRHLGLLPLASIVLFLNGYVCGAGPIPLSIMPELLPQRVRGMGSCLMLMTKWIMSFVVTRFFKNYLDTVGNAGGYWTFASVCALGVIFATFFLPETKGKSLEQIQIELNGKSKDKSKEQAKDKTEDQNSV